MSRSGARVPRSWGCLAVTLLTLLVVSTLVAPWIVGAAANDHRAKKMMNKLVSDYRQADATIVETQCLTGHAGSGSQTKVAIWAGVLLYTDDPARFESQYPNLHSVDKDGLYTQDMQWVGAKFELLKSALSSQQHSYKGYYIADALGNPFAEYFDLRGH